MQEAERASSPPIILGPNLCLSKAHWGLSIENHIKTLQPQMSVQELTINFPKILVNKELAITPGHSDWCAVRQSQVVVF